MGGVNIEEVNYMKMPGQIEQMRDYAIALNKNFTNVYESINGLKSTWYGERYNDLARIFNDIVDDITNLLTLVVGSIPTSLDQVANNYSQADRGTNVTTVSVTSVTPIESIQPTASQPMEYKAQVAQEVQGSVETELNSAISNMDSYESVFNSITWVSDAATQYKSQFINAKNNVTQSINNVKSQFTKLMQQAERDMTASDNSNMPS